MTTVLFKVSDNKRENKLKKKCTLRMSFASERGALFSFNAIAVRIELWTPRVRFRESGSIAGLPDNKDVFISCFKIG